METPDELGKTFRDTVTGVIGICTTVNYEMHGDKNLYLEAMDKKSFLGTMSARWFSSKRLEEVEVESE